MVLPAVRLTIETDYELLSVLASRAMLLLLVIPTLLFEYVENRRERREGRA